MKNTKLKRIAAVIGCALVLISVFVVPAAAAPALDPQPESPAVVYPEFYNYIPGRMKTVSFANYALDVQSAYANNTDLTWQEYIMSSTTITSGIVDPLALGYPFFTQVVDITQCSAVDWSIEVNGDLYGGLNTYSQIYFYNNSGQLALYESVGNTVDAFLVDFRFADYNNTGVIQGEIVRIAQVQNGSQEVVKKEYFPADIDSLSMTFASHYDPIASDGDSGFVAMLGNLFFGDSRNNTRSAYDYYYGFCDGVTSEPDNVAYQRGYDAAVRDIDSGDFGRNLLGNILHSPFSMLRSFTVVSWKFGTTLVTITMADLLSAVIGVGLFIWLLKIFAGG